VTVVGDAVFYLFNDYKKPKCNNRILINFGTHDYYNELEKSREIIVQFIQKQIVCGAEVFFVPFHSIDKKIGTKLKNEISDIILLDIPKNYSEALTIFCDSEFAIGERLHFNIMSAMSQCPFVSINYATKHLDFLKSIEMEQVGVSKKDVSPEFIEDKYLNQNKYYDWDKITSKIQSYKDSQEKEFINSLMN
jgi:polysaccharide pyruvyl transferase WcaK-like protein